MGCTPLRFDHLDFNKSTRVHEISKMVPISSSAFVCAYMASQHDPAPGEKVGGIFIRSYDVNTATLGTVNSVSIANTGAGRTGAVQDDNRFPHLTRLSTGRLICAYAASLGGYGTYVRESTDDGATWSAEVQLLLPAGLSSNNYQHGCVGIESDGTDIFMVTYGSAGTGSGDLFLWRRTGIGTWNVCRIFNNVSVSTITATFGGNAARSIVFRKVSSSPDTWQIAVVFTYNDSSTNPDTTKIACLERQNHVDNANGDESASWNLRTVHDYTGVSPIALYSPLVIKGADNILRIIHVLTSANDVYSADSTDWGQSWTDRGALTVPNSRTWDSTSSRTSSLASNDWWFISTIDGGNGWFVYRNEGLTNGGWSLDASCSIDSPFQIEANGGVGDALVLPDNKFTRLTSDANALGGSFFRLWLTTLTVTTPPGPEGPPCNVIGNLTICPEGPNPSTQLCGPTGLNYTYLWTFPDGSHSTQRCIAADQFGTYTLVVTDPGTGLSTSCEGILALQDDCPENLSSNRIFRRGILKVQRAESPQPNYTIRPFENLDKPLWGGS